MESFPKRFQVYFFAIDIIKIHHNEIGKLLFVVSYEIQTEITCDGNIMRSKGRHPMLVDIQMQSGIDFLVFFQDL
jgi:hypothetical protein